VTETVVVDFEGNTVEGAEVTVNESTQPMVLQGGCEFDMAAMKKMTIVVPNQAFPTEALYSCVVSDNICLESN
jgi:lipopolysaccharide export system protein LptA